MRRILAVSFFGQAFIISFCLADRVLTALTSGTQSYAFVSLQMMSSLRQGSRRSGSASFKRLSALSSTPFPATAVKPSNTKQQQQQQSRASRSTHRHQYNATSWSSEFIMNDDYRDDTGGNNLNPPYIRQSPFPTMPSPLFTDLAQSQFELLSNSLIHTATTSNSDEEDGNNNDNIKPGTPKISSMVLYLPKENPLTGQLEFVPAVTYPNPSSERVFIAHSQRVHQPPTNPSMGALGLPGFFPAKSLIPSYPFVSSADASSSDEPDDTPVSISVVEEIIFPNDASGPTSLSVTLFSGLDTLAVFMIWPYKSANESQDQWKWTSNDKLQVTRAAKSLALALSMDNERASTQLANEQFRVSMTDSLHQMKSPLQALRTYGKLLQRQLAEENTVDGGTDGGSGPVMQRIPVTSRRQQQALKLAEDMMSQGERVVDLIGPMDALVENGGGRYLLRGDIKETSSSSSSALILQPSNESERQQQQQLQLPPSLPIHGEFELELVYPGDILGSIVYASQAISREKGINFDAIGFDPDNGNLPGVTVCQKHLKEAVSNILDNAIKYAPVRRKGQRGRPRIPQIKVTLVSNEPPLSPGATLYIEDNGCGIPKSEQAKVFERGYRGENVVGGTEGSGLGLAIAKEYITRMGGLIDFLGEGPNKLDGTSMRIVMFRDVSK